MAGTVSGRVDPRTLLRSIRNGSAENSRATAIRSMGRAGVIGVAAAVSMAAFGTLVVRASDDTGALAFIRSQAKPRAVAVDSAPPLRQAYQTSYFAPRTFFPQVQPAMRRQRTQAAPPVQPQRQAAIVASYAPFIGFLPLDTGPQARGSRSATARVGAPSVSRPAAIPATSSGNGARGNRVSYCVRTCDGFFFPLSAASGSDSADQAACNRLCPTSETRLYVGQIGVEIDDARSRQTGRRYAQMSNAFAYRTSYSRSCSCSASGVGLTNEASVGRDLTLRPGDIVMTAKGMRVFSGGQMPYREANFMTLDRSGRYAGNTRETLQSMENASVPRRTGVARQEAKQEFRQEKRQETRLDSRRRSDELADFRRAAQSLERSTQVVRYVGPNRSMVAR